MTVTFAKQVTVISFTDIGSYFNVQSACLISPR